MPSRTNHIPSNSRSRVDAGICNTLKDVELSSPPDDSVSALSWSPTNDHLAVASWDNNVTIYNMTQKTNGEKVAVFGFGGPVLDCAWSLDGSNVVGVGADCTARVLALGSGTAIQQVAVHDAPIRTVRWFKGPSNTAVLATGSWDKTIKYWDLRQASPIASLSCSDKIYSMDAKDQRMVFATADRQVGIVDLNNPAALYKLSESPLLHQTRVVSCSNDGAGYAIGSIEGRCGFRYISEKDASRNFAFRCHRSIDAKTATTSIHTINAISFHPIHGTFSTAGSDGSFTFWDKDAHARINGYGPVSGPISATDFNKDGNVFSYAVSYDWSKGYAHNSPGHTNKIMLHTVSDDDCKPRPSSNKRR